MNKLANALRELLNYTGGWDTVAPHPIAAAREALAEYDDTHEHRAYAIMQQALKDIGTPEALTALRKVANLPRPNPMIPAWLLDVDITFVEVQGKHRSSTFTYITGGRK